MKRLLSVLLLPLSVIPIVTAGPLILHSRQRFVRQYEMGPLPAPAMGRTAAEVARFQPFPAPAGQVPVLAWHGIGRARDGYTVTQATFARQLALLKRLGYTAISTRQWADFRARRPVTLPAKPILLTFDDGRLDSYRGADRVLQREGMRAAMFVITGHIDHGDPSYLSWSELHAMRDSGHWDIEPHAHDGHREITVSPDGARAPFYAARQYTRSNGRETLAAWEARVDTDLFTLRERFAAQGIVPHAFAVPYGDYGQRAGNDPAIPRLLSALLTRQFGSWFIQADDGNPRFSSSGSGPAQRFEVRTGTGLDSLYGWLRRRSDQPRNLAKTVTVERSL